MVYYADVFDVCPRAPWRPCKPTPKLTRFGATHRLCYVTITFVFFMDFTSGGREQVLLGRQHRRRGRPRPAPARRDQPRQVVREHGRGIQRRLGHAPHVR